MAVSTTTDPVVCKLMDYGKVQYQKTKKQKETKKKTVQEGIKEMWVRPNTGVHDLQTKMNHVKKFLEKGNRVIITVKFKGRELSNHTSADNVIEQVKGLLEEHSKSIEIGRREGRQLKIVVRPIVVLKGHEEKHDS